MQGQPTTSPPARPGRLARAALAVAGAALLLLAAALAWIYRPGQPAAGGPAPLVTIAGTSVIYPGHILQPGEPAPDFTLETLDGKTARLADLRGRRVIVNFWASWCVPCREEMPALQQVHDRGRLVVLGVNALDLDDEKDARDFVAGLGLTFPVLFDRDGSVQRAYNVRGLPTSFLVGADGNVVELRIGQLPAETLQAWEQAAP